MFKQQSDAIIGKKDVGIGANGMKVMFTLNDYYNRYYKSLKVGKDLKGNEIIRNKDGVVVNVHEDPEWFTKTFHMGGSIGTVRKTASADVWMDEKLHRAIAEQYGVEKNEKALGVLKNSRNGWASLYISGIISGATDNAKNLLMAKINAINDLASMHLYLLIMGFTAKEVSAYMNSDIAQYIVKRLNSTSVYDSSSKIYISDILTDYLKDHKEEKELVDTFRTIYEGADEVSRLAGILKINQTTSADTDSMYEYLTKFNKVMYAREHAVLNKGLIGLRTLDDTKESKKLIDKIISEHPNDISESYVRDTIFEANKIPVYYIDKNGIEKSKIVSMVGGQFDVRFYTYPKNKEYRDIAIKYYNLFKSTFNTFDVIEKSSHFKAMINGLSNVHLDALKVSKKYNFVFNTALDILREKAQEIFKSNKDYNYNIKNYLGNSALPINTPDKVINRLLRAYDGFLVASWLKTEDLKEFTFSVQGLLKQLSAKKIADFKARATDTNTEEFKESLKNLEKTLGEQQFGVYASDNAKSIEASKSESVKKIVANSGEDFIIDLTTDYGIANFKKIMETLIFPILKESEKSKLGELLRTRSLRNPYGLFTTQITPTFGISSLDNSVNVAKFQDLLYNFNQVDNKIERELVIQNAKGTNLLYQDLFYLYNLIVNNEQYGDNRLTALMQDYVKDPRSIAYKYLHYSTKVDLREVDIFKINIDQKDLDEEDRKELEAALEDNLKNDIIFSALNNNGRLNIKRLNNAVFRNIVLKNPDFVINTFMDITDNIDTEKYTNLLSLLALLRDSNLLINFKCE
jgi:hypothetical protein